MTAAILHMVREGLYLVLLLSAPPLVAVLAVGLVSAILQTATQVRDVSLSTVPKIVAALLALAATGPWIGHRVLSFTHAVLEAVPRLGKL